MWIVLCHPLACLSVTVTSITDNKYRPVAVVMQSYFLPNHSHTVVNKLLFYVAKVVLALVTFL